MSCTCDGTVNGWFSCQDHKKSPIPGRAVRVQALDVAESVILMEMVSALRKHLASPCVKHYQTLKELLSRYDRLRNYDLAGKDVTLPR